MQETFSKEDGHLLNDNQKRRLNILTKSGRLYLILKDRVDDFPIIDENGNLIKMVRLEETISL